MSVSMPDAAPAPHTSQPPTSTTPLDGLFSSSKRHQRGAGAGGKRRGLRDLRQLPVGEIAPAAVVVALGCIVLNIYSIGQWRMMSVPSWDLAIFSEAVKAYAHFQAPIVPIKGVAFNLLGDHFHPIIALLAPVWWIAPTPLALLVAQNLLFAVSAWPLTRLAARILNPVMAFAVGAAYVLSWGIQAATRAQFHEIAFAMPLLAWAGVAYVERRWVACGAWLIPLIFVKEDMGLTVFLGGLAIAWSAHRSRCQQRESGRGAGVTWGLGVAATGVVAFIVTVGVILPALSPTGAWEYGLAGNAGDGSGPAVQRSLIDMLTGVLSPSIKITTLALLIATLGVIGLSSPWAALMLPTLAWRFLSTKEAYWEWQYWHYNAILIPIATIALLDVLKRLQRRRISQQADSGQDARPSWCATAPWVRLVALIAVCVPVVTNCALMPRLIIGEMTQTSWGEPALRAQAAREVMELIPDGASVGTDLGLLAYLVPTAEVYWVGTAGNYAVDYVVIDQESSAWGGRAPGDAAQWASQVTGVPYVQVLAVDGYLVAQRADLATH